MTRGGSFSTLPITDGSSAPPYIVFVTRFRISVSDSPVSSMVRGDGGALFITRSRSAGSSLPIAIKCSPRMPPWARWRSSAWATSVAVTRPCAIRMSPISMQSLQFRIRERQRTSGRSMFYVRAAEFLVTVPAQRAVAEWLRRPENSARMLLQHRGLVARHPCTVQIRPDQASTTDERAPRPRPPLLRQAAARGAARLEDRRGRRRRGSARCRRARDDRLPDRRQCGRGARRHQSRAGRSGAGDGAGAPEARRRDAVRAAEQDPRACRMGGLGQRDGRARARLPRHVPRRRLRASRRFHPAHPRRRAADRAERRRTRPRHRGRLRDPRRAGEGDLAAPVQEGPRRTSRPGDDGRHRRPARPAGRNDFPGGEPCRASRLLHAAIPQGRDQLVEGVRSGLLGKTRDRGCGPRHARRGGARADLRRRGFGHRLDARRAGLVLHGARCPRPASGCAASWRLLRRRIPPNTRRRR